MDMPCWRPSAGLRVTAMATLVGLSTVLAPMVALADDLINNIDNSPDAAREVIELTTEDGVTSIRVQPQGADGKSGCNLTGSTTLVVAVASSDPSVVKVADGTESLTFGSCDDVKEVKVRPQGVTGQAEITFTQDSNTSQGTFNFAPANFTVNVTAPDPPPPPQDTTAPVISYTLAPADPNGNNGWYTRNVDLTWSVTDPESDIIDQTGCGNYTFDTDGDPLSRTCTATSAGGESSETATIKRDATNPSVALTGDIANGDAFYFSFVPAEPGCEASDALSGLDGTCWVTGYKTAVGNHTVQAHADDLAGNRGHSDEISYEVLAWTINGFFRPVDMGDVLNTVKGGSTVPLKFQVFAGDLELTDTSVVKNFSVNKVNCNSLDVTATDAIEVAFLTTGGTSLRYDATDDQFVQNWKTPTETGCYVTTMKTQDGSSIEAFFKVK